MKVRATSRAQREIAFAALWWQQHRDKAPQLFLEELETAELHLSTAPASGQVYGHRKNRLIRRWLLEKTEYWVYFSVDRKAGLITVQSVWSARRGRQPNL